MIMLKQQNNLSSPGFPLKEIEIQLTFNGIVMEFQLSLLWTLCLSIPRMVWEPKRKRSETAGRIVQLH